MAIQKPRKSGAGAPKGNKNAAKAKVWSEAINRALEKRAAGDRAAALDALAEKLLGLCDEGDLGALQELGNRLEGKPVQMTELSGPDGGDIPHSVAVVFVGKNAAGS